VSRSMKRLIRCNVLALSLLFCTSTGFTLVPGLRAQEPAAQPSTRPSGSGWVWVEQFAGSGTNGAGQVMSLTSTTGYDFTSHFGLVVGLPVYFIHDSASTAGATSSDGIGDVFAGLHFSFPNPVVNFRTALTGTAPTGDTSKGLSTGHATLDWTNHFDRRFGRLVPFANLGLANSVPDTLFYQRQYTSYGYLAHFQAGTSFRIMRPLSAVASAYDIEPWGMQTVTSRIVGVVGVPGQLGLLPGVPAFEQSHLITGGANLTRDDGFSAGLDVGFARFFDAWAGYSHSLPLNLNTVSIGVGVNVMSVLHHANE
jgi:hypothetical protein